MPTYDYVCDACDHKFELFQGITEEPKKKCPDCGKRKLRRLFGTGAAIVFKGSGFYSTDYRSEGYKKAAAADTNGAASSDSKSGDAKGSDTKGADSKPAQSESSGKGSGGGGRGKPKSKD
jgi:putative FmdB family regulatory protein